MAKQYVWIAISGAVFAAGIGIGYAIFASTYAVPQQMMLANQQQMNRWMQDPATSQQMMGWMYQNPQFMQNMMNDPQFQRNWMYPYTTENWRMGPGMGPGMMGGSMMNWGVNPADSQAVETNEVTIPNDAWNTRSTTPYQPLRIQVQEGTQVTWTNEDDVVHTVTDVNNEFDSNLIGAGESWSYTFSNEGTYNYYCTLHPWMRGAVLVQ